MLNPGLGQRGEQMKIDQDHLIDAAEAKIQRYNLEMRRRTALSGIKPHQKDSIVSTINVQVFKPLHDRLREVSEKTGISQRRLIQEALAAHLEGFERKYKGSAFSRRG